MEQEKILTGYCRCIDGSRTVFVEDGEPDCLFENCPHAAACLIAEEIRKSKEKQMP